MQYSRVLLLLFLHSVKTELEVNWVDSSDVVQLSNPADEFIKNRILVALEKETVNFTCKVNFASKLEQTQFKSSEGLEIKADEQSHQEQSSFFFTDKTGKIENVESSMDDATIQCKYDITDGPGRSVGMTLSVWSLKVSADDKNCGSNVILKFKEAKTTSDGETNVENKVQEKIKKLTKEDINVKDGEFVIDMNCNDFKKARDDNTLLKRMSETVDVNGEPIDTELFLKQPQDDSSVPKPLPRDGLDSGLIGGISAGVVVLVLGLGLVYWKKEPVCNYIGVSREP